MGTFTDYRGLPRTTGWARSYWMWGYPTGPIDTVIGAGHDPRFLRQIWEVVEIVKSVDLDDVDPHHTPFLVAICRRPKIPMERDWPQVRPW